MRCFVLRCLSPAAFAWLVATSAIAAETDLRALTYYPWTKSCFGDTCFIGSDGRTFCGPVAGAVFIERKGETKRTLRVMFPNRINLEAGVRIVIDDNEEIERPYASCLASQCMADYEAGPELVDQLKYAQALVLKATDNTNAPINLRLPLSGFAKAYDGPSHDPKVIVEVLSEEQMQAKLERETRANEERRARCGAG